IRVCILFFFFFSSRRRHTRLQGDWSSDVCSSDLKVGDGSKGGGAAPLAGHMLEPLANDMRLRDLASARFRFNVRHQWLRQSYGEDRKSTRLNSSHLVISYAVFCLKKKNICMTKALCTPRTSVSRALLT